jgi:hypothetical protein
LGIDEKTAGNWAPKYGSDGFIMLRYFYGRDCQAFPEYVSAIDCGHFAERQLSTWNTSTGASLLTSPISYCARYLGAVETRDSGELVVYLNDLRPHILGVYVCDFEKAGREQTLELLNLDEETIAPAQKATDFTAGMWLRYHFSGSFRLRLRNLNSSTTAVLSALMFDSHL